jgi:hypothetical protein
VSCESRGGFVVLVRQSTAEGASQSGGLVSSFFFLFLEGVAMSEEWNEVVHEVQLMVERLRAFRDDLSAAENSGALTALQGEFVKWIGAWALETAVRIEQYMTNSAKDETAEEGATE